jgi:ribosomal protein L11 methyltransferase
MPFLQLSLDIGAGDPASLEDALFAAGATSVTLQDSADDPILEPKPGETPLWPTVTVHALFDVNTHREGIVASVAAAGIAMSNPQFEVIEDRAWEREWLKDFKPMRFGQRLWVCPGGMSPPAGEVDANSILLQLDPGLAFGTGTHPTTALCLEWLDQCNSLQGQRVIDYGCGSGILAIAALRLGAASALGTDIDPQALTASRDNAERNHVSSQLTLTDCEFVERGPQPAPAPIVMANILAGPLGELAPLLAQLVTPGGHIVLSGLLKNQAADLAQRYGAWFDMDLPVNRDDWSRLSGRRR